MRLDASLEETERRLSARDTSTWAALVLRVLDDCHPEQRDFAEDPARYLAALVGRGGGKTTGGRARFVRRLLTTAKANCVYIAKTQGHAKRLMWIPLKDLFKALGFVTGQDIIYHEVTLTLTIVRNGSMLRLCGADKPADIESLRGETFHEVGIDEGASHPDALLTDLIRSVIGPRLVGSLWVIGSPGKRLKGLFYEVTRRGSKLSRPWGERHEHPGWRGWSLHRWTLKSAIEATASRPIPKLVELYETQQLEIADSGLSDDNPNKRREYDGEWAADDSINIFRYRIYNDAGELWNQWDPERVGPLKIGKLPTTFSDWAHVVALDLGYMDPTAINVFSFSPSDPSRTIYHRLCIERTKLYSQAIAHLLIGPELEHDKPGGVIGAIGEWPNAMVADSAHQMAQSILDELSNVYGVHIEPAVKGFRYKVGAIELVNGDLFDGRIRILKDSLLEAQLIDLQWDESKSGELIERKGQPNHSTDTLIYGRTMISNFLSAFVEDTANPRDRKARSPSEVVDEFAHLSREDERALFG